MGQTNDSSRMSDQPDEKDVVWGNLGLQSPHQYGYLYIFLRGPLAHSQMIPIYTNKMLVQVLQPPHH